MIEQALADNTAAIKEMTALLRNLASTAEQRVEGMPSPSNVLSTPLPTGEHLRGTKLPPADGTEVGAAPVDFETLKAEFLKVATASAEKAKSILLTHGIERLSQAKPEQYADILAHIRKAA